MKKRVLSVTLILMVLLLIGTSHGQTVSNDTLVNNAVQYFDFIRNNDFHSASRLFHYPGNYTKQELTDDMNTVSNLLAFLANEFGGVLNQNISEAPTSFYHVLVGGGDLPYWQKHPHSVKLTYKVDFEKEGRGYVRIRFCNISGKWEIRQVEYGLPTSRPDSRERIMTIMQKMMQPMQQSNEKQNS